MRLDHLDVQQSIREMVNLSKIEDVHPFVDEHLTKRSPTGIELHRLIQAGRNTYNHTMDTRQNSSKAKDKQNIKTVSANKGREVVW